MIFILKNNTPKQKVDKFIKSWEEKGFSTIWAPGTDHDAVCLIGNTSAIDMDAAVHTSEIVSYARRVTEQYKAASRAVHPEDTVVEIGKVRVGGGRFTVISGPCSVESTEQMAEVADAVKKAALKYSEGVSSNRALLPTRFRVWGQTGLGCFLMQKSILDCLLLRR